MLASEQEQSAEVAADLKSDVGRREQQAVLAERPGMAAAISRLASPTSTISIRTRVDPGSSQLAIQVV